MAGIVLDTGIALEVAGIELDTGIGLETARVDLKSYGIGLVYDWLNLEIYLLDFNWTQLELN